MQRPPSEHPTKRQRPSCSSRSRAVTAALWPLGVSSSSSSPIMKKEIMIFNFTAEYRPLDVHNLCSRRRELHLTYETKFRRAIKITILWIFNFLFLNSVSPESSSCLPGPTTTSRQRLSSSRIVLSQQISFRNFFDWIRPDSSWKSLLPIFLDIFHVHVSSDKYHLRNVSCCQMN